MNRPFQERLLPAEDQAMPPAGSPLVIPVFVAHQGCPHRCLFCDQYAITGRTAVRPPVTAVEVAATIRTWLARPRRSCRRTVQVAFYGGSFTGIAVDRQHELLQAVRPFLRQGLVDTIRLSTRPDYIEQSTVSFLQEYGVSIVELGVQSMDPVVLAASKRGHTGAQVKTAVHRLQQAGMTVGIQLMIGLPQETVPRLLESAARAAALRPDFVRIYPTMVLQDSGLHRLYAAGRYRPLSLLQALARAARLKRIFDRHSIRIVRMGLQSGPELQDTLVAGPFHPAFGELVLSRIMFQQVRRGLRQLPPEVKKIVAFAPRDESILRGPGNINMNRLRALGLLRNTSLARRPGLRRHTIAIEVEAAAAPAVSSTLP